MSIEGILFTVLTASWAFVAVMTFFEDTDVNPVLRVTISVFWPVTLPALAALVFGSYYLHWRKHEKKKSRLDRPPEREP